MTIPWRLIVWVSLALSIAGGGWYIKGLLTDNAQLRQEVSQWQTNYDSLNTVWRQERDALSSRESAYQELAVRNHSLNKKLGEALDHAAQNDTCVTTPVPPAVGERLRSLYHQAVPESPGAGDGADTAP